MNHPLKCPSCGQFRYINFVSVRFENGDKGFGVELPFFQCYCGKYECAVSEKRCVEFKDSIMPTILSGEFVDMPLKFLFSNLDKEKRFKRFDHLDFKYDARDYYLIPGLFRGFDEGYLTPVFFDKDILLYYNSHPDYSVQLYSFSSGNIYYKGSPLFNWGFGINRNGKIFKWLGDLSEDFKSKKMEPHLKRFQASNIDSDHDIASKFYLSQNPFTIEDAFQESDNENKIFSLKNRFEESVKKKFGLVLSKLDIEHLSDYYKHPILNEREQIFSSYLSLNKYLIENLEQDSLRSYLHQNGYSEKDLKGLKSIKLFERFLKIVLGKENIDDLMTPVYVLYDLRQLHGHLSDKSFATKYNFCKKRLGTHHKIRDFTLFQKVITVIIEFYRTIQIDPDEN